MSTLTALKAVEWEGLRKDPNGKNYVRCCPECEALEPGPHEFWCELFVALTNAVEDQLLRRAATYLETLAEDVELGENGFALLADITIHCKDSK